MKTATAKELKQRTASLLADVRRGSEILITRRGKSVAVLVPAGKVRERKFLPIGFGMWRDRAEMRNVRRWLGQLRAPRYGR